MEIGQAYIQIMPTTEGIGESLASALGGVAAPAGEAAGATAGNKIVSALGGAAKIGAAAVGTVAAGTAALSAGFISATGSVASYGDNIDKASQKLGLSAGAYQEWDAVLQHSGTSISAMTGGMKSLSKALVGAQDVIASTAEADRELEAQLESGEISLEEYNARYDELYDGAYQDIGALGELGLSMADIEEMSGNSDLALEKVIAALQQMPEGAERSAIAQELLGKSAMELGPLLNTSAEDTAAMRDRVRELGGVMSDEAVKSAAAYQDSLQDMQTTMSGIKNNLVAEFLPGVTAVMDGVTEIFAGGEGGGKIQEGINSLITSITSSIPSVVEAGGQIVQGIGSAIIDNIPAVAAAGTEIIAQLLVALIAALPAIVEAGLQAVDVFAGGISESIHDLVPVAIDAVLMIVDTLVAHAPELLTAALSIMLSLATGLIDALPDVIAKIPQIVSSMVDSFASLTPQIVNAGVSLLSALVRNMPAIIGAVIAAAPQVVSSLVRAFGGLVPEMVSVGVNLIAGIGKGLLQGVGKVLSAAKDSAAKIISGIKGFFGVHSPSTITTWIGEMLPAGEAQGILKKTYLVLDAARDMASGTLGTLASADMSAAGTSWAEQVESGFDAHYAGRGSPSGIVAQVLSQGGIISGSISPATPSGRQDADLAEIVRLLRLALPQLIDKRLVIDKASLVDGLIDSIDRQLGEAAYYRQREALA